MRVQETVEKRQLILASALDLLKESGDAGLTMRQLANRADMRLSNVQYYFKSKNNLLIAMVDSYFDECIEDLRQLTDAVDKADIRARARVIIQSGLSHGSHLSDICRIFRELWAISSRNPEIEASMQAYYRRFSEMVSVFILGADADRANRSRVSAMLIPYFEGYSITAKSLSVGSEVIENALCDLVMAQLD